MKEAPSHLGGHLQRTWIDAGVLAWAKDFFDISSMVDVGCGPCGMAPVARDLQIEWFGVDGDPEWQAVLEKNGGLLWDFQCGPPPLAREFDLGWCVEFLEHVEEQYQGNYMAILERCQYVVCTAAPPGWKGHHHANLKSAEYWHQVFSGYGLDYDPDLTSQMKHHSTMKTKKEGTSFMTNTGIFYRKRGTCV